MPTKTTNLSNIEKRNEILGFISFVMVVMPFLVMGIVASIGAILWLIQIVLGPPSG